MNFPENHILGKYWGCVALVLDSYMEDFDFWGYKERAILLQTQPFLNTALGPAKLYIVGSKNCSLSYMNTIEDDTQWDISGLQANPQTEKIIFIMQTIMCCVYRQDHKLL